MSLDAVRRIADAVLYEGYVLYPYRASAPKNRSRWQFGVLMSPDYPAEPSSLTAEVILEGAAELTVILRFLQLRRRADGWDEGIEREVTGAGPFTVDGLTGLISVERTATKVTVRVENRTRQSKVDRREEALPTAMASAHLILHAPDGRFISMLDPPEWAAGAVAGCRNEGVWPVLVGPDGSRSTVLAAPIILPEYPHLAPESPGDLYDGTEIDEILTLRTLTLTDEEKAEARATDPRAAALIDRTEALDGETLAGLHGRLRQVYHVGQRVRLRPGRRADAQDMFVAGRVGVIQDLLTDVDGRDYVAVSLEDDPGADLKRFLYFGPDEVERL